MNIPPMPKWPGYDRDIADPHTRECHYADALCDFASHLESLCKQGWAEAERLEAALHRDCPDHDHRPKAQHGYKCAHCLEEAWAERDALRAQVKELAEALEECAASHDPITREAARAALSHLASAHL